MLAYLSDQPVLSGLLALIVVTSLLALLLPLILKVPTSSFWLSFSSTLGKTFRTPGRHPIQTIALVVFLLLLALTTGMAIYYYQNRNVVARVGDVVLTTSDLEAHDRVYNGVLRYQKSVDGSVALASRKEVLEDLIATTKLEIEARKRSIFPKKSDIEEEKDRISTKVGGIAKLKAVWPKYGWTEVDFTRSVEIDLLKASLEKVLVVWREAEFVSLRWDVLADRNPNVSLYRTKATQFLKAKEEQFAAGAEISALVNLCKEDKNILVYFPRNAIGSQQLANNPSVRELQKTTADKTNVLDQKILSMKVPTKSEVWCDKDACYLIRVVRGNQGTYLSLEDWLAKQ